MMKQINKIVINFNFKPSLYVYKDRRSTRKTMYYVNILKNDARSFIDFKKNQKYNMGPERFELPSKAVYGHSPYKQALDRPKL